MRAIPRARSQLANCTFIFSLSDSSNLTISTEGAPPFSHPTPPVLTRNTRALPTSPFCVRASTPRTPRVHRMSDSHSTLLRSPPSCPNSIIFCQVSMGAFQRGAVRRMVCTFGLKIDISLLNTVIISRSAPERK